MQLDRTVAARKQGLCEARVVFRRGEPAGDFVTAHRARVSGNLVTKGADQLVHGQPELAPRQIPQRHVDDGERPIAQLAAAAALPVRKILPQALAVERILAQQHGLHEAIDQMRTNHFGETEAMTLCAVIGGDGEQRLAHAVRGTRMRMAVAIAEGF